ncbi:MAG: acyl-CoA dehydrogenase [Deltaproteobacteria bacterium]|nr:acyl-CoA dehydrogenase [Deltaproteobacteria bacterium]
MGDFYADLRDMRFVLFEQLRVQELSKTTRYGDFDQEMMDAILTEGFNFSKQVVAPTNAEGDRTGARFEGGKVFMPEIFGPVLKAWGENGWTALIENPEYGGQGAPLVLMSAIDEMFVGANCALSLTPMLTIGAAHLIEEFGEDWMKGIFLEKMYSHKWAGTMCLTEPQAGSDVGANRARAIRQPDGAYKIIGTKNFISSGDQQFSENIIHMVLARTEGAPPGTGGISLFLVPKLMVDKATGKITGPNDVAAANIEHKMGIHGSPTCTMNFGDNEQCFGWLIGEEHKGMRLMFHMMNEARVYVGMQGLGLAAAGYEKAVRYANERLQGPSVLNFKDPAAPKTAIVNHPDVKRMLMDIKAAICGMRSLFLWVAYQQDVARSTASEDEKFKATGVVELLTPVVKAFGSDLGVELSSEAMQVMGGYGYCTEYEVEQMMRDARIAPIYEGTNGIQAMDLVGRKLGMKGGQYFMNYVFLANKFLQANKTQPGLEDAMKAFEDAKNRLAKLVMKFGNIVKADIEGGLQWAKPFLNMFGYTAIAFELLKQAVVAKEKLEALFAAKGAVTDEAKAEVLKTTADGKFYNGKLQLARYWAATKLPLVPALEAAILSGNRDAIDFNFHLEV